MESVMDRDWTPEPGWGEKQEARAKELGMMSEQLSGRSMETFFEPAEEENLTYAFAKDVDDKTSTEIDAARIGSSLGRLIASPVESCWLTRNSSALVLPSSASDVRLRSSRGTRPMPEGELVTAVLGAGGSGVRRWRAARP